MRAVNSGRSMPSRPAQIPTPTPSGAAMNAITPEGSGSETDYIIRQLDQVINRLGDVLSNVDNKLTNLLGPIPMDTTKSADEAEPASAFSAIIKRLSTVQRQCDWLDSLWGRIAKI